MFKNHTAFCLCVQGETKVHQTQVKQLQTNFVSSVLPYNGKLTKIGTKEIPYVLIEIEYLLDIIRDTKLYGQI